MCGANRQRQKCSARSVRLLRVPLVHASRSADVSAAHLTTACHDSCGRPRQAPEGGSPDDRITTRSRNVGVDAGVESITGRHVRVTVRWAPTAGESRFAHKRDEIAGRARSTRRVLCPIGRQRPALGEAPVSAYPGARAARGDPGRSEQMAEHRNMRASDADRAHIAEQLRRATDEGRLLAHEFDDRLGQALNARTYRELDAIVADLPRERVPAERPGIVGAVLRRRLGPVVKAAATAGAVAAAIVILLAPPTHVASQRALSPPAVASQRAPVSPPAAARPTTAPPPPAPPRTPQQPSPPAASP